MQMSRFSSDKDPGYVAVSDQLWLWVETLQKEYEVQAPTQGFGGTQPGFASSQNAKTQYLIDSAGLYSRDIRLPEGISTFIEYLAEHFR